MQTQVIEVIRAHPQLTIREALALYYEQCKEALDSIHQNNISKIEGRFNRVCTSKYGEDAPRLSDYDRGSH